MDVWSLLFGLVSPIVAVIVAFWGFRRSRKADQLTAFFEVLSRYGDPEVRNGRRLLHTLRQGANSHGLDDEERRQIAAALSVMNSIAVAVDAGLVQEDLVRRAMGSSYSTAMNAARIHIDHLEQVRGYRPFRFAEALGKRLEVRR